MYKKNIEQMKLLSQQKMQTVMADQRQFQEFLDFMARLYKYTFSEQRDIYLRKPDATACADYNTWTKRLHRKLRRGSGIPVIRNNEIHYFYDVSDTISENPRPLRLWQVTDTNRAKILSIIQTLPEQKANLSLPQWIKNQIDDGATVYTASHHRNAVTEEAKRCASYIAYRRCGLTPETPRLPAFQSIEEFYTFGTVVNFLARNVLIQVEKAAKRFMQEEQLQTKLELSENKPISAIPAPSESPHSPHALDQTKQTELTEEKEAPKSGPPSLLSILDDALRLLPHSQSDLSLICSEFQKEKTAEEHAMFLASFTRERHIGLSDDTGKIYTVSFDAGGIDIDSHSVSWLTATQRIQQMLDNGTYAGQDILDGSQQAELCWIARRLLYIRNDLSDHGNQLRLLPTVTACWNHFHSYPDAEAHLIEQLQSADQLEILQQEYQKFTDVYQSDSGIMRFHYDYIQDVGQRLSELSLPQRSYQATLGRHVQCTAVVSDATVQQIFRNMATWTRYDLQALYLGTERSAERIKQLKEILDTGGTSSTAYSYNIGLSGKHSGLQIHISYGQAAPAYRRLTWNQIDAILKPMAENEQLLTDKEQIKEESRRATQKQQKEQEKMLKDAWDLPPEEKRDSLPLRFTYYLQNLDAYESTLLPVVGLPLEKPIQQSDVESLLQNPETAQQILDFLTLVQYRTSDAMARIHGYHFQQEIKSAFPLRYLCSPGDTVRLENDTPYEIIEITPDTVTLRNPSEPLIPITMLRAEFDNQLTGQPYNDRFQAISLSETTPTPPEELPAEKDAQLETAQTPQVPTVEIRFSEHPAFYDSQMNDRFTDLSFALGNKLLGVLDEKQHREREDESNQVGWYHKTDFVIKAVIDGEEHTYEGRFDIGDGEGDLIAHIKNFYDYSLSPNCPFIPEWKKQGEDYYRGKMKSLRWGRDVFIPFLEQHTELTPENEKLFAEIMSFEKEWFVPAEEKKNSIILPEQTASSIKAENPNAILFYQVGDFFELYGNDAVYMSDTFGLRLTNKSVGGERMSMCGIPGNQLETYLNMLNDRGLDVAVSSLAHNERTTRLIVSQQKLDPVESRPIGRIDYLHTDGKVRESIEYTSAYLFEKDIKEENYYGVPMVVIFYKDKDGKTIPDSFLSSLNPPLQDVQYIDSPYWKNQELSQDKTEVLEPPAPRQKQTLEETLDEYPISMLVDGRWQTYPDVETAEAAAFSERKAETQQDTENFRITDDALGVGGPKEKFRANVAAIRVLKYLEENKTRATPEQQQVLSQYVGWGGLADAFDKSKNAWSSEYQELKTLLTPSEYQSARASVTTAFYTPPMVIRSIYQTLERMGLQSGRLLDPACGTGHFLGMLPDSMSSIQTFGVEVDFISASIAKQLYPETKIAIQGYEQSQFQDNTFDAIVGNVPFGDFGLSDNRYNKYHFLIHDYFFAKALDQVRPGGIVAFITSKGTMDKTDPSVRRYLAQRAELLGAVRLPDNTFRRNAGTEVTSDILFLQKRAIFQKEPEDRWITLQESNDGIVMNRYFVEHPEMICGEMQMVSSRYGMTSTCKSNDIPLSELLASATEKISGTIPALETTPEQLSHSQDHRPADPALRPHSFAFFDGNVYFQEGNKASDQMIEVSSVGKVKNFIPRTKAFVSLRDCLRQLIRVQIDDGSDAAVSALQAELNQQYDTFAKDYGRLNSRTNRLLYAEDDSYYLLCSLEELDNEKNFKGKAAIFYKRTILPRRIPDHVDNAPDALHYSLSEKGGVDLAYMAQLTGKEQSTLEEELSGLIYRDIQCRETPETITETEKDITQYPFVTADEYLSGNVRQKLRMAKSFYAALSSPAEQAQLEQNITALQAVQPADLDASEIKLRLGTPWLKVQLINQFVHQLLNISPWEQRYVKTEYIPLSAKWYINGKSFGSSNVLARETYGTKRVNALEIIEDSLNQRDVRIYDRIEMADGKKKSILNEAETQIAQGIQQTIQRKFEEWVWEDPERRKELVNEYNERFNSLRNRQYDGSYLALNGINPEIQLRPHQKNAVARILSSGNTLLAHVVGAGKTFTMAAAAMECKRLGRCNKPLIAVPNNIVGDFATDFMRLYPGANLLVTTEKDFKPENRKRFCGRIATGDYDAVIISHSQFEKIQCSVEWQRTSLNQQLDALMESIQAARQASGRTSYSVKELERSKKRLQVKLEKLNDQSDKDNVLTFEELGTDMLFVDEADLYKNLYVQTKMGNVAGITQGESKRASDLYMKTQYLNQLTGYHGVVFATGTPVSNFMAELYTMQRYLQYETLERYGIQHFDAWAAQFGEAVTKLEIAPEGKGLRMKTRFAKYNNLPELMTIFKEVADIQTEDMLDLPLPTPHYEVVAVKPSEAQQELVSRLVDRAKAIRDNKVSPDQDNMLVVTNDGKKLALDQRLLDSSLPDDPNSKINACVEKVYQIWKDGTPEKLTQMIFCDTSTPKGAKEVRSDPDEFTVEDMLALFDEKSVKENNFTNIYGDIKQKLLAKGIPEEEIAFIHDANTNEKKKNLFADVRAGKVRILLGSTQKMGAGTNAQTRLVAIHDLDCPWRPRDLEQRRGRIVRQGNQNKDVYVYRYITEGTFDSYLYQMIENKQRFISQIFTSKLPNRTIDEIDATVLNYAEIKALATGNPLIMERANLEADVQQLNILKKGYLRQKYGMEDFAAAYPAKRERAEQQISLLEQDIQATAPMREQLEKGVFPGIAIDGHSYTDRDEAKKALGKTIALHGAATERTFGTYCGFQLTTFSDQFQAKISLKGHANVSVKLYSAPENTMKALDAMIVNGLQRTRDTLLAELETGEKTYAQTIEKIKEPFPQEKELQQKTARLQEVTRLLQCTEPEEVPTDPSPDLEVQSEAEVRPKQRLSALLESRQEPAATQRNSHCFSR